MINGETRKPTGPKQDGGLTDFQGVICFLWGMVIPAWLMRNPISRNRVDDLPPPFYAERIGVDCKNTLPETNISPQKMDGWKYESVSFLGRLGPAHFQGQTCC